MGEVRIRIYRQNNMIVTPVVVYLEWGDAQILFSIENGVFEPE